METQLHHQIHYIDIEDKHFLILGKSIEDQFTDFIDKNVFLGFYIYDINDINNPKKLYEVPVDRALAGLVYYIQDRKIIFVATAELGGFYLFEFDPFGFSEPETIVHWQRNEHRTEGVKEYGFDRYGVIDYFTQQSKYGEQEERYLIVQKLQQNITIIGDGENDYEKHRRYYIDIYNVTDKNNIYYVGGKPDERSYSVFFFNQNNKKYAAFGGQYVKIFEIDEYFRFQEMSRFKISSIWFQHFEQDGKYYLIAPSLMFIAVLEITDPSKMNLIKTFPSTQYVFRLELFEKYGEKYLSVISHTKLEIFSIDQHLNITKQYSREVEEGSLNKDLIFGTSSLDYFVKNGMQYIGYSTLQNCVVLELNMNLVCGQKEFLNQDQECQSCQGGCLTCVNETICKTCNSYTRDGEYCDCRPGYKEISGQSTCEKIIIVEPPKEAPKPDLKQNITEPILEQKEDSISSQEIILYSAISVAGAGGTGSCLILLCIMKRRKKKQQEQINNDPAINNNMNQTHDGLQNPQSSFQNISALMSVEQSFAKMAKENEVSVDGNLDKYNGVQGNRRQNLNNIKLEPLNYQIDPLSVQQNTIQGSNLGQTSYQYKEQ